MKLRIKGNTLRLRLSQTEISDFASKGIISDSIDFGGLMDSKLVYSLKHSDGPRISASFGQNVIEVFIPRAEARHWTTTDKVSLQNTIELGNGNKLDILVEKDFQCLHKRPNEDEKDNFPNPLAEKNML